MSGFRVGTSGFAYREWVGSFYPDGTRGRDMLSRYAERFDTVELNTTFHHTPPPETVRTWLAEVPDGFRFTVKAHQRVTHWLKLMKPEESVPETLATARAFGPTLGAVLFQVPPRFRYREERLAAFLDALPADLRAAMEFRDPTWEAGRPLLAERGVAWVTTDADARPAAELAAEPFAYARLRRTAYTDDDLRDWATRIRNALAAGRDVWCYLKHESKATEWARRLRDLVGTAP